jgi:hypothetical protein
MSGTIPLANYNFLQADTSHGVLDTMKNALDIQGKQYQLRGQQANEAIGNILQQSTDAQGNVDYVGAQRRAAAAGPIVQMGMQTFLENNANRRGQQIEQANGLNILVGKLSASAANDPSDENMAKIRAQGVAAGLPDSGLAEIDRISALPVNQRSAEALKHTLGAVDAMERLHIQMGGKPITIDTGGSITGGTQNPITGAISPSGQPVQKELDPSQAREQVPIVQQVPVMNPDGTPKLDADGKPVLQWQAGTTSKGNIPVPGQPPAAPTTGAGSSPFGTGRLTNPDGTPKITAPPALGNPNKPAAPAQPSQPQPLPMTTTSAPPQGQPELLQNDIKLKQDASTAIAGQNTRLTAGQNAMEALQMAGNYTGAGTGTAASLYAWLQARGGTGSGSLGTGGYAVPQGNMSETAWREVLAKNLLRFAQDQGRASGTDLGLETNLASQANADRILPSANRHILIQDIGTLRQQMAQTRAMPDPGAGTVRDHIASYPTNTDRRGFAWDYYSQPERDAIEAEVHKKGPAAEKALDRAIEDAVKYHFIPDPRQAPKAAAPASPPPARPAPPRVPVTMNQPNALAAYA